MEKALSIWQANQDSWVLLGAKSGVMQFDTLEEVDRVFEDKTIEKADKVRFRDVTNRRLC